MEKYSPHGNYIKINAFNYKMNIFLIDIFEITTLKTNILSKKLLKRIVLFL